MDQVLKYSNRGGEGIINDEGGEVFEFQGFQRLLHFGQWGHALRGGSATL
jgi:hypothetical protein